MDLLRRPEYIHVNASSLKPSDKRQNVLEANFERDVGWMGVNSNVKRAMKKIYILYDYYPSQISQSILFLKVMFTPFLGFPHFRGLYLEAQHMPFSLYYYGLYMVLSSADYFQWENRHKQLPVYKTNVLMVEPTKYRGEGKLIGLDVREGFMK